MRLRCQARTTVKGQLIQCEWEENHEKDHRAAQGPDAISWWYDDHEPSSHPQLTFEMSDLP